jgi:hypothetical protein
MGKHEGWHIAQGISRISYASSRVHSDRNRFGTVTCDRCGPWALVPRNYGINPHSNILLAMGAATLLMNTTRICGSLFRNCIAFCSCGEGGCGGACFFCHNCSQGVLVYFATTLAATLSRIGYWSWAYVPVDKVSASGESTKTNLLIRLNFTICFSTFRKCRRPRCGAFRDVRRVVAQQATRVWACGIGGSAKPGKTGRHFP